MRQTVCLLFVVLWGTAAAAARGEVPFAANVVRDREGGVVRGDVQAKRLALILTGGDLGESAEPILDELQRQKIKAGFFLTGGFLRQGQLRPAVERMLAQGHYVGPHSDAHPLYAPWDDRSRSLVTASFFKEDLAKNIADLRALGALPAGTPILFVPPNEWYNADQAAWSRDMGVKLINFTSGSGSNRDYVREGTAKFVPSQQILDDLLTYEQNDPHGLNGFLLLLHLGSGRKDPFHPQLGALCDELQRRGYEFARVDRLLLDPQPREP